MMKHLITVLARWLGLKALVVTPAPDARLALLPAGDPLAPVPSPPPGSASRAGIVIVSYFGLPYLQQCLDSVFGRTAWPDFRVVVVDNGSDAETLSYLETLALREPRLQVVTNGRNLGFAAANNIGLRMLTDCDTMVLLNNDTVVPPDWLGKLVHYAARPDLGLVGPVTNWTGNEARIETRYQSLAEMEQFARETTAAHAGQIFDISVLAMYCVAFRREVFERAGELDEAYGLGMFEDVDYAEAVRQLGLRVVCCEDIFVHHYGMASFSKLATGEYQSLFARNREYYTKKWGHPWLPFKGRVSRDSLKDG
jgi:GT2 family glycosyltransferase